MELNPHSNYDPRHFLHVGYDTVAVHLVSALLLRFSYSDLLNLVKSLPWVGSTGNRKHRGAGFVRKPDGLVVWLSLPRVLQGSNIVPLGHDLVVQALRLVAEAFGVPFDVVFHARLYRLDVVANLPVQIRPSEYVRRLVHVGRAHLHPFSPTSRAFLNKTREIAFYDKVAELVEKGRPVPEAFCGRNVLRYELRTLKGLTRLFGRPIYAADLAEPEVFRRAVTEWAARFKTVRSQRAPDFGVPKRVPDLMRALAAGYVADHGAEALLSGIEANCADGLISPTQGARQRGRVLELASGGDSDRGGLGEDPVVELRAAVQTAKALTLNALP